MTDCNPNYADPNARLTVAVSGSGFQNGAAVDFGARISVREVTFISDTQLDVRIRVNKKAGVGPRDVTVTNPGGLSGSKVGCFAVN